MVPVLSIGKLSDMLELIYHKFAMLGIRATAPRRKMNLNTLLHIPHLRREPGYGPFFGLAFLKR